MGRGRDKNEEPGAGRGGGFRSHKCIHGKNLLFVPEFGDGACGAVEGGGGRGGGDK